jgi:hypothetical protein
MAQATLPARPHLGYLKKLAKERVAALRAGGAAGSLAALSSRSRGSTVSRRGVR